MKPEDLNNWIDLLTDDQKERLKWLQDHRCLLEASWVPADLMHGLPAEAVLKVTIDRHGLVKVRGDDISQMFDYAFNAAKALFDYVEVFDPGPRGARDE